MATGFGCFVGAAIITMNILKIMAKKLEEEIELKNEEMTQRINAENRMEEFKKLEIERNNLHSEVNQLKNMKLDVNSITKIMELGVAKADISFTNFQNKIIKKEKSNFGRDEEVGYIGALHCSYVAKLGVDLTKIRISNSENGTIDVSGIETENLGVTNSKKNWLLSEIRLRKHNGKLLDDDFQVCKSDELLAVHKERHQTNVEEQINNGVNLRHFDAYVTTFTKDFLSMLLKPLGKEIRFLEDSNLDGLGITEYLICHNNETDEVIRGLKTKLLPVTLQNN